MYQVEEILLKLCMKKLRQHDLSHCCPDLSHCCPKNPILREARPLKLNKIGRSADGRRVIPAFSKYLSRRNSLCFSFDCRKASILPGTRRDIAARKRSSRSCCKPRGTTILLPVHDGNVVFDVLRKAGFEEGAEGDGENLKFESNNSSAAVLFETDMTRYG